MTFIFDVLDIQVEGAKPKIDFLDCEMLFKANMINKIMKWRIIKERKWKIIVVKLDLKFQSGLVWEYLQNRGLNH